MVNEKEKKIIKAWDTAMSLVLGEMILGPEEIEVLEEVSKHHVLTDEDIDKMAGENEANE